MKKKFREIVVDGEKWAWSYTQKQNYYRYKTIKIWKDKKNVFEKSFGGERNDDKCYVVTPKLISRFIKLYLKR